MRLSYSNMEISVEFEENVHNVLVIKNKMAFCQFIEKLQFQCQGEEEGFLLIKKADRLPISKKMLFYSDIVGIDCNEKKILTKYYKSLEQIYNLSDSIGQLNEINTLIINLFEKIMLQSDSNLTYNIDVNLVDLLKLYDVKIANKGTGMYNKIHKIIDLCARLNICEILSFVNLKLFLTVDEIINIYQYAEYMKIHLLLIETIETDKIPNEVVHIIDEDLCEIVK